MTVNDIAVRLKFSQRQIEALENDRYELLPIASIARGMARSYAKLVGVEPAPLLAMLNSCAAGVTVVNIDNGFGAGYAAHLINTLR